MSFEEAISGNRAYTVAPANQVGAWVLKLLRQVRQAQPTDSLQIDDASDVVDGTICPELVRRGGVEKKTREMGSSGKGKGRGKKGEDDSRQNVHATVMQGFVHQALEQFYFYLYA